MDQYLATIWEQRSRPEQRLLLACARAALQPGAARVVPPAVDWADVLSLAERHRVVPLLYEGVAIGEVPAEPRARLRARMQAQALRSATLSSELIRVLTLLEEHGVQAIPYKGPALAQQAYGSLAMRQGGDLDLLIHAHELLAARAALMAVGYHPLPEPPGYRLTAEHFRLYHEYSLVDERRKMRCELQWGVMETPYTFPPPAALERWRAATEAVSIGGRAIRVLPREAMLLVLCVHGAKHLWERLYWLCDVAALAQRGLDWAAVQDEARRLGVERLLLLGLRLAEALLGVAVPAELRGGLRTERVARDLAGQALGFLLLDEVDPQQAPAARNTVLLRGLDRLGDRLATGARFAPRLLNPIQLYRRHGLRPILQALGLHKEG